MQWQYQTSSLVGYNWFLELEASLNAQSCAKPMCNDKNQKGHAALLADVSEEWEVDLPWGIMPVAAGLRWYRPPAHLPGKQNLQQ